MWPKGRKTTGITMNGRGTQSLSKDWWQDVWPHWSPFFNSVLNHWPPFWLTLTQWPLNFFDNSQPIIFQQSLTERHPFFDDISSKFSSSFFEIIVKNVLWFVFCLENWHKMCLILTVWLPIMVFSVNDPLFHSKLSVIFQKMFKNSSISSVDFGFHSIFLTLWYVLHCVTWLLFLIFLLCC